MLFDQLVAEQDCLVDVSPSLRARPATYLHIAGGVIAERREEPAGGLVVLFSLVLQLGDEFLGRRIRGRSLRGQHQQGADDDAKWRPADHPRTVSRGLWGSALHEWKVTRSSC